MEILQVLLMCLIAFATGVVVGIDVLPILFQVEERSTEYVLDDMEIAYVNGSRELIHDVAQVEVGEKFILMSDTEKNIMAIIPNREIEYIKSIRKDIE